jgi:hypothetical protein
MFRGVNRVVLLEGWGLVYVMQGRASGCLPMFLDVLGGACGFSGFLGHSLLDVVHCYCDSEAPYSCLSTRG